MVWPSRESLTAAFSQRVVRPKSVIKFVSESVSIRRACAYISRRFYFCILERIIFRNTISFSDWFGVSGGYPLAVDDSPKTREIPRKQPKAMMFSIYGYIAFFRRGKRVTLFGGVRGAPRNSFSCKATTGLRSQSTVASLAGPTPPISTYKVIRGKTPVY
ncbi:hypothetical protein TNCV_1395221 [Trichonephila clavipes]|nr:hypothetical protein TNCV_1395221 [Trichonephila clavipes]